MKFRGKPLVHLMRGGAPDKIMFKLVSEKDIQISQNPNKNNDNYKLTLKNGNIEISAYSDDYTGKVPDGYSSSPNHRNAFRGYEITINANGKKTDYVNEDMKQFNSKTVVASKDVKQIMIYLN
jgi:hypothetical protein